MADPELNLLVLRSADLERSVGFYSLLGLSLVEEKHGRGPTHFSTQLGTVVLELYPTLNRQSTQGVRLGFTVDSVDATLANLESEFILKPAFDSDRGRLAYIIDPDGHTIELLET